MTARIKADLAKMHFLTKKNHLGTIMIISVPFRPQKWIWLKVLGIMVVLGGRES